MLFSNDYSPVIMRIVLLWLWFIVCPFECTTQRTSIECLKYVIDKNVRSGDLVYNVNDANMFRKKSELAVEIIAHIMLHTNVAVINVNQTYNASTVRDLLQFNNHYQHNFGTVRFYVLHSIDSAAVRNLIKFITVQQHFNSKAYFMLQIFHNANYNTATSVLNEIFQILWNYYIFNTIVILCATEPDEYCRIYTWFPYDSLSVCGQNVSNHIEIDMCQMNGNNMLTYRRLTVNYLNQREFVYSENVNDAANTIANLCENILCPITQNVMAIVIANDTDFDNAMIAANWSDVVLSTPFKYRAFGVLEYRQRNVQTTPSSIYRRNGANKSFVPPERRLLTPTRKHLFNKIPNNMLGCAYNVSVIIWPPFVTPERAAWIGLEHKLIIDIARFMNFNIVEKYNDMAGINDIERKNQAYRQILDELQNKSIAFAFGNLYPTIELHQEFDYSIGYLYDQINWVVPLAGNQPLWMNLGSCFSIQVWSIIGIITIVFTILYSRIAILSENRQTGFLDCIGTLLQISIGRLPRSSITRIFLMFWAFYCLHISLFYQSHLIRVLTSPQTARQIRSSDDLMNAKIPIGFPSHFKVHLQRINTKQSRYFLENGIPCSFASCLNEMSNRSFATIGNRMFFQYLVAFENINVRFVTIQPPVAKSFVEMLMTQGFPLRERINQKIRRMIELGYLAVSQRIFKKICGNTTTVPQANGGARDDYLKQEHFDGAFFLLGIGITLAACTLFMEILYKWHCARRAHKQKLMDETPTTDD